MPVPPLSPRSAWARLGVAAVVVVLALVLWWLNGAAGSGGAGPAGPSGASGAVASGAVASGAASPSSGSSGVAPSAGAPSTRAVPSPRSRDAGVRAKARSVLDVVDATGRPPKGYVGGRQFLNDGRGGTAALPRRDAAGRALTYHEYDVNPYRQGVDRGPERLVVGSDGSAFWTADHYDTWQRLR